ncbi:hypothetical protein SAY87_022739 [Trapa incisa]|uniref:Uncharacterized protein n=1 Tax=Trapa incisa TaxID=236973 RepID=A0AAN7K8A5_9MYRT|nr:hypothetical protein SAY87_022739 [Trapa incisa]
MDKRLRTSLMEDFWRAGTGKSGQPRTLRRTLRLDFLVNIVKEDMEIMRDLSQFRHGHPFFERFLMQRYSLPFTLLRFARWVVYRFSGGVTYS